MIILYSWICIQFPVFFNFLNVSIATPTSHVIISGVLNINCIFSHNHGCPIIENFMSCITET